MTKQELEHIRELNEEINALQERLLRLRQKSLTPQATLAPQGGNGGNADPVSALAERKIELEQRIAAKKKELHNARDEAVKFIYTIPDEFTRKIVFYRCVSLMSWRRVAYEIGGGNSEDGVRMAYSRFWHKM